MGPDGEEHDSMKALDGLVPLWFEPILFHLQRVFKKGYIWVEEEWNVDLEGQRRISIIPPNHLRKREEIM